MRRQPGCDELVGGILVAGGELGECLRSFLAHRVVGVVDERNHHAGTGRKEPLQGIRIHVLHLRQLQCTQQQAHRLLLHEKAFGADVAGELLQQGVQRQRPQQLLHSLDEAVGLPNALVVDPRQGHGQQLPRAALEVPPQAPGQEAHALCDFCEHRDVAFTLQQALQRHRQRLQSLSVRLQHVLLRRALQEAGEDLQMLQLLFPLLHGIHSAHAPSFRKLFERIHLVEQFACTCRRRGRRRLTSIETLRLRLFFLGLQPLCHLLLLRLIHLLDELRDVDPRRKLH
mmetsp:Transcript_72135/g.172300  ORF Transcript_72135/g.172300 Transcript_72135/m.172300 type:complete len:285 (+) Transcript_72135:223-1077(+)